MLLITKPIILTGLLLFVMMVLSFIMGVKSADVFDSLFQVSSYGEERTVDAGVDTYEETDSDLIYEMVHEEDKEGEMTAYADFLKNPPEFDGEHMYVTVNRNRLFFTDDDKK